jgi:hypothetical protein
MMKVSIRAMENFGCCHVELIEKVGVAAVDLGDKRAVVTSVDVQATAIRVVPVVTTTSEYV